MLQQNHSSICCLGSDSTSLLCDTFLKMPARKKCFSFELLNETIFFWGQNLGTKPNKEVNFCACVASLFLERSWNAMLLHSLKHIAYVLCFNTFFVFSSTYFSTSGIKPNFFMQNQFVFASLEMHMQFNLSFYLVSISWNIEGCFFYTKNFAFL